MRRGFKSKYHDPQKLIRIRNLQLLARTVVEGYISGLHRSPFKGFSAEFAEYREYLPGDDLKHFDWKVYARSDKRYVKQYEEETNLTCTLMLDCSGSMAFKSDGLSKFDYGCFLVAALTYLMILQRDQVGLVIFDEEVRRRIPPSNSPAHLKNVLEQLERIKPTGETVVGRSLHSVAENIHRRGLIIIVSDLIDDQDEVINALNHFRHDRSEVIVFNVFDPAERDLPYEGLIDFLDLETGRKMQVRPDVVRNDYGARFDAFVKRYREACAASRVDYQFVTTDVPFELMLAAYLNRREKCK
ncbi:MAG: DUF58 domain-containing protein [Candidatus Brocadiae bacterium]|nr:DUF58 domain-containing protein [Candidatus Brocadiia bacterium]